MVQQYEKIRRELIFKFLKREDNLLYANKIFMAISVLNWIVEQNPDKNTYEKYMGYIGKYMYNEIELYWDDGVIKFKITKD